MAGSDWDGSDIPGWAESDQVQRFYRFCFHPEIIDDLYLARGWIRRDRKFGTYLRGSLDYLIEQRPVDTSAFRHLTHYSFRSDDELYDFLVELRDYVFGDRQEHPIAPAP
ncbi:hypothetical protein ACFW1A_13360 [Kitasatospora sp. NPDC058965]|uniref:hypothetical protein n=1 Tax=Kitasatospora sp. NPDC058965 TaxID=3346682 RepID=UPI003675541E